MSTETFVWVLIVMGMVTSVLTLALVIYELIYGEDE